MTGTGPSATTTASTGTRPTTTSTSSVASTSSSKSSSAAAASSSSAGGGGEGGGEEFEGEATFYAPGLGSCGTDATDADYVAALSKVLFDATGATNSNNNPYCGRKALVKAAGGKRRRWEVMANTAAETEDWDKTRNQRWSRRSVVSAGRGSGVHMAARNASDFGLEASRDNPPMPGITPPPKMGPWKRQAGGGGVTVTVVDRCPVCKQYDLDLSPAAYNVLGNPDEGRIAIKWKWLD